MKSINLFAATAALIFSSTVFASPVNINMASASEIAEALSGIGMSKASAIVEYRNSSGKFNNARDIVLVKGIGEATYQKNIKDILVE